jgi:hypothetical protein
MQAAENDWFEPILQFFRIAAKDRFAVSHCNNFIRGVLLRRLRGEKALLDLECASTVAWICYCAIVHSTSSNSLSRVYGLYKICAPALIDCSSRPLNSV